MSFALNRLDLDPVLAITAAPGSEANLQRLKAFAGWDDATKMPLFLVLGYLGKGIPFTTELGAEDLPPVRFMDTIETGEDDEFGDPDDYLWNYPDFPEDTEITY